MLDEGTGARLVVEISFSDISGDGQAALAVRFNENLADLGKSRAAGQGVASVGAAMCEVNLGVLEEEANDVSLALAHCLDERRAVLLVGLVDVDVGSAN